MRPQLSEDDISQYKEILDRLRRLESVGVTLPYTVTTGFTPDRSFNPSATTLNEVAAVLGTLITDLRAAGMIG